MIANYAAFFFSLQISIVPAGWAALFVFVAGVFLFSSAFKDFDKAHTIRLAIERATPELAMLDQLDGNKS